MRVRHLPTIVLSRPSQVILHGGLIATCAAFGSTLAASLFLAHVGARSIPIYYMLFAALSIPLSVAFSAIIDRWARRTTIAVLLIAYMITAPVISLFLAGGAAGYFGLYIVISALEQLLYSVYYIFFSDYFTVTEGKRYGGAMTIALGVGAMLGSLLVSVLSDLMDLRAVILALPFLVMVALLHLRWLTRREQPLDEIESAAEEGLMESLKALPKLSFTYPIVVLMAAAVFVNIAGQCVMEFEAFSIYANHYSDAAALASFLGKMTAAVDLIGILVVFLISDPLIPRVGVANMGLVAPAINLGSFLILGVTSSLPAGILAHLNYYPLEHSLNVPVFSLAYNAVPHRFVGRARVINDGIVYPIALAAAGLLLALVAPNLSLGQVAMIGAADACLYCLAQWGVGRQYLRGLIQMLRSGAVDFDRVSEGFKLPDDYRQDIRELLAHPDAETVALGVELASRCDLVLSAQELEQSLPRVPLGVARSALARISQTNPPVAGRALLELLQSSLPVIRARALEALVIGGLAPAPERLDGLLQDGDETVRAIAAAFVLATNIERAHQMAPLLTGLEHDQSRAAALYVLNALPPIGQEAVLAQMGSRGSAECQAQALSVAASVARRNDPILIAWGRRVCDDRSPAVRAAAFSLLVQVADEGELGPLCRDAFADTQSSVRRAAAIALGRRGDAGLASLAAQLRSYDLDRVGDAMEGIGVNGPARADPVLFEYLSEAIFPVVARNLALVPRLPTNRPSWRALRLAIDNSTERALQSVLQALTVLGYKRVLALVRAAMRARDARTRANAVETLASLAHRRYVLPLLPVLEAEGAATGSATAYQAETERVLLTTLLVDDDPFIRAAALAAWSTEYETAAIINHADTAPVVQATCRALAKHCREEDLPMNRLVFLKSVALFAEMSLEPLMAVDAAMTIETYLAGEEIVREGDWGDKLFILFRGEVAIRKHVEGSRDKELARLQPGQVFGEMALFDDDRRSATVAAVAESELFALDRERFQSLAYQRPEIPLALCKVLATRLRSAIS